MGHRWILDVLTDLRSFALANDLPLLAEDLARSARIAAQEIGEMTQEEPPGIAGAGAGTRDISGTAGTCGRA